MASLRVGYERLAWEERKETALGPSLEWGSTQGPGPRSTAISTAGASFCSATFSSTVTTCGINTVNNSFVQVFKIMAPRYNDSEITDLKIISSYPGRKCALRCLGQHPDIPTLPEAPGGWGSPHSLSAGGAVTCYRRRPSLHSGANVSPWACLPFCRPLYPQTESLPSTQSRCETLSARLWDTPSHNTPMVLCAYWGESQDVNTVHRASPQNLALPTSSQYRIHRRRLTLAPLPPPPATVQHSPQSHQCLERI